MGKRRKPVTVSGKMQFLLRAGAHNRIFYSAGKEFPCRTKKVPFCLKGGEGGRRALKGGIVYKKEGVRLI